MTKNSEDFEKAKHDMKMEELKFKRESERIYHEHEMERGRIKSAEIRKMQMRKEANNSYRH